MRIVRVLMILGNGFDPDPRVLAEARALVRAGCGVEVIAWDRDGNLAPGANVEGIRVLRIRLPSTHGRGPSQIPHMLGFHRRAVARGLARRFDLVWCHDLDTLPPGYALSRARGVPVVFDAHESYPDMLAASLGPALTCLLRRLERTLVRRVEAVVTVGGILADWYRAMGARRVLVAGNWKDPARFRPDPGTRVRVRRRLGVPEDAFLVSDIGWMARDRQLAPLVRAIRGLPEVWLLLAGRGPMEGFAARAATRCARIRFPGWVHADRVPALTAASDAVFYGFDPANGNARFSAPNKLFEAIAAGKPVVTGPFGEIAAIVRRERCGVVLGDYSVPSIRAGIEEVRTRPESARGGPAARLRYTRLRADRVVTGLVADLVPGVRSGALRPAGVTA